MPKEEMGDRHTAAVTMPRRVQGRPTVEYPVTPAKTECARMYLTPGGLKTAAEREKDWNKWAEIITMVSKQGTDKLSLEAAVILGTVTSAPVLQQQQYKGLKDSGMSDLFAKVAASAIFISQECHYQEEAASGHHDMVWKRHYDAGMTARGFKRTVEAMLDSKGHWQSPLTPEQVQLMAADLIWASKRYLGQDYFSADLHGRTWSATAARKMLELLGNCGFTLQGAASSRGHRQLALDLTKRFDALQQRGQDNPEVHELVPKNAKRFPNMTYT